MERNLYNARNILFVLVVGLLAFYFNDLMDITPSYGMSLYLIIGMLAITYLYEFLQKNKKFNYHKIYNIASIITLIYILVVMAKGMFDYSSVLEMFTAEVSSVKYLGNIFFARNAPYIVVTMLSLMLYTLVLNRESKL
ncbi:MAG: hypothetical protein PHY26_02095 [Bacilli bacterium]|nr:hypothetical protein [Bacilli bacterium]